MGVSRKKEPVDINSADAKAIAEAITGVGLSRAEWIIDYRLKHGPFESVDDLVLARGIGAKTVEDNRAALRVGGSRRSPHTWFDIRVLLSLGCSTGIRASGRIALIALIVMAVPGAGKYSLTGDPIRPAYTAGSAGPASAHIEALQGTVRSLPPALRSRGTSTDLDKLQARGNIRVLHLMRHEVIHPGRSLGPQFTSILEFAASHGLTVEWVGVETRRELVSHLKRGNGDLMIDQPPFSALADPGLRTTVPLSSERYVIIVPTVRQTDVNHTGDLLDSRIAVSHSSPMWPLLNRLLAGFPSARFQAVADHLPADFMLQGLGNGEFDALLLPASVAFSLLATRPDYAVGFALTEDRPVAWHVRADNPALKAALDDHLVRSPLLTSDSPRYYGDLAKIQERRLLRVLMLPDRDNFFLQAGARAGFEYELVKHFASERGLHIDLRVADDAVQLLRWLKEGHGDLIASRAAIPYVREDPTLALSRVFNYLAPTVVTRSDNAATLRVPADLYGRRVLMPGDPSYRKLQNDLRASGTDISAAPPFTASQTLLDSLTDGRADAVIVDSHRVKPLIAGRTDLRAVFSLNQPYQYRWAVRNTDPQLLSAVDDYLKRAFRSKFYNIVYRRYFEKQSRQTKSPSGIEPARISPYDELIQEYAARYGFDWRLIAAQVYEESRFDADAVSEAGARGLMQVLPSTGYEMGFYDLADPEISIHAGVRYLDRMRAQLEVDLPVGERTWFSLAAYHAGFDRMRRARQLAKRLGLDPKRWFGNVEKAMVVRAKTANGQSCSCRQTVTYVREVRSRYRSYVRLAPEARSLALH